jgi:hypothetical protein
MPSVDWACRTASLFSSHEVSGAMPRSTLTLGQVSVSTYCHPAQKTEADLEKECQFLATRRSGPGGQHRNKVETAVIVTHRETGVRAEASERRSQGENRKVAYQRLRVQLALHVRRIPLDQPTELWQSRVRSKKIAVNPGHQDFPSLLAEFLDQYYSRGEDLAGTANILGITSSQGIKFLKLEPLALEQVNRRRLERGLHALK